MASCSFCGSDTQLFDNGRPVCLEFDSSFERRREFKANSRPAPSLQSLTEPVPLAETPEQRQQC